MEEFAKPTMEKREAPRYSADIGIVCQPYSSTGAIRNFRGTLHNYSSGGMYVKTRHDFKAGTILVIRITQCAQPSSAPICGEGLRTICLAEIKWRRNLSDRKQSSFGLGLRYLD